MPRRVSPLCLLVLAASIAFSAAKPHRQQRVFNPDDEVIPGVVIVKFLPGVEVSEATNRTNSTEINRRLVEEGILSLRKTVGFVPQLDASLVAEGWVDVSRMYSAEIAAAADPRLVAGKLGVLEGVEYAEPKFMNYLNDTPNDPLLPNQTNMFTRMNAYNGWTIAKGDTSVYIAVVDGGTYWLHEDLQPNYRFGWNFANNTNNPQGLPNTPQSAAHGTATASHFGARTNNGIGMAGSSWNCSIIAINAASPTTDNAIAFGYEGIAYAYANGAKVINCSWGRTGGYSQFEQDLITAATQAGALVVCAAGNGTNNNGVGKLNDANPDFPPSYKNVLAVGATNSTSDARASFSNYGRTVPVYAPGVSIYSAFNGGGYGNGGNGTSYSSPLVAGLAGILKSQHPTWTPRQIALQIKTTCDSIDGANPAQAGNLGRGRVNFARALSESHAGIDINIADIRTPGGRSLFLQNDTIVMTLTIQNVLFVPANNLVFTATSSSASVTVLQGTANAGTVAPGQTVQLPSFQFRVGTLTSSQDVVLRLDWVSNGNERDSWAYKVTVFPSVPQWETQPSPTTLNLFSVKAVNQNVVWACGGNGSGTAPVVVRTSNSGANWVNATGNLAGVDLYCITAIDENRAWAGTGNGRIYATSDGGVNWTQQTYPGAQSPFINAVWMFSNGTGFSQGDPASGGRFVILKTTDFGSTWMHLPNEPVGGASEAGWNNSFAMTDVNNIWFGTNASRVWRTTDGGATWTSASSGATNSYALAFKDNSNGIVAHSTGAIRVTSNGGSTWNSATSPTTSPILGVGFPAGGNFAWVIAGATPYRSTNNGTNWLSQTVYPIGGTLNHIAFFDTSYGWGVTSSGEIVRYRPPGTTDVAAQPATPAGFELEQNYPNPFNPETEVRYRTPEASHVTLAVYDILGREVGTLVDEVRPAGAYVARFNAGNIASGVYYYRLTVGRYSETKKMILVR